MVGAIVLIVSCLLPWYTIGGEASGLPAHAVNALGDLGGLLLFLAALGVLALVTLPYAAGDRPVGVDRWPVYLLLFLAAAGGLLLTILSIVSRDVPLDGFRPDRSSGAWLAAVGLVILARATFEIFQEPDRR